MRNRAKCKLCGEIIESFAPGDYVVCKCGEIGIHGGSVKFECMVVKDWDNFVRIDDDGKEIPIKVMDKSSSDVKEWAKKEISETKRPCKADLLVELDRMIANMDELPQNAMLNPITHYDLAAALILLSSILRSD